MRARRNPSRGMTLVEVVLGLTLFCAFASSAYLALQTSSSSYRTETAAAHLDFLAQKALDDVSDHLRAADFASITPPPTLAPNSTATIDFQGSRGFVDGAVEWGPVERLTFESDPSDPDDGLDNDGDGLIDEGRLAWIEDPDGVASRRAVLCSQVSAALEGEVLDNGVDDNGNGLIDEDGLSFVIDGDNVTIRLTLERPEVGGHLVSQTVEAVVNCRN